MADRNLAELPRWARALLRDARVGHLGFLDERDRPRVLPVTFALAEDRLYSAVDEKPKRRPASKLARLRYLSRSPQAALTVDHYEDDWRRLAWVQVLGEVRILEDPGERPQGLAALAQKYEPYRPRAPRGPLLELIPGRVVHWRAAG